MQEYQASKSLYGSLIPLKASCDEIITHFQTQVDLPIDCRFLSADRLFQVFVHKSFTHENREFTLNNEKLEFVGDAVLDLLVSELIFHKYPTKSEGDLSKLRSSLVNEKSLALIANSLGMGKFLLLGRGEVKVGGFDKPSLLSDAFEALLGAIFIDHGFIQTKKTFKDILSFLLIEKKIDFLSEANLEDFDSKTKFQEMVMKKIKTVPTYKFNEKKSDKETLFEVELWIEEKQLLSMVGESKKRTMQALAKKAIEENVLNKYMETICY